MKKLLKKAFFKTLFFPCHIITFLLGCVLFIGRLSNEKARYIENTVIKLEKGK